MKYQNDMAALNGIIRPYKWAIIVSSIFSLLCLALVLYLSVKPSIVVITDGSGIRFFAGTRGQASITEENVEIFLKNFVEARYGGDQSDTGTILRNISPMVTKGLLQKIKRNIVKSPGVKQATTAIRVSMVDKGAWVSFHLVVEIKGIPFIVTKKLFVQLVRGSRTKWNPMGIYLDKITVYKKAKGIQ